jgi:hypothetical protein
LDAKVAKATYTAHTILYATTTATPAALTVGASTVVGRASTGNIVALSKSDLLTLLNVADGANAYVHPTTSGNVHVPEAGATTQMLQWSSAGTAKWVTVSGQASIADGGAVTIALLGASAGAVTASKALIVDANKYLTGLNKVVFGVFNSTATTVGDLNLSTTADDTGGVQIYAHDGGADNNTNIGAALRSRLLLTVAQAGGGTNVGVYGQIKTVGALSFAGSIVEAGYFYNQGGTVTLTGTAYYLGINAAMTLAGTMSVGATAMFAGIDINLGGVGPVTVTTGGVAAGLVIRHKGEGAYWPIGIYLPGGTQAYTPIQIGIKANTAGSGLKLVATGADDSAGVQIYAEDGGSKAAVGQVISPLRSRYLLTSTAEDSGISETGLFAQLVSTGAKAWSGGNFMAAYVFNQAGTITLTGTATNIALNVATTTVGAMTVGATSEMAGIDVNIRGSGAFAGTAANAAAIFITSSETPVWPNGLKIKSGGALVGIDMATTTRGIVSTVSTLAPGSTPGNSFIVTAAAPANDYGAAGYFEADAAGTFSGHFYAMGSWINFGTAAVTGGNIIAAQDNGIYGTATMTSSIIIFGMRMEAVVTGTPGQLCPFSLNTDNKAITALFNIASAPAIGELNSSVSVATEASGTVPLYVDAGGTVKYVHVYTVRT